MNGFRITLGFRTKEDMHMEEDGVVVPSITFSDAGRYTSPLSTLLAPPTRLRTRGWGSGSSYIVVHPGYFSSQMVGTGGCLINVTIHADMVHGTLLLFGLVAATLSVGKV